MQNETSSRRLPAFDGHNDTLLKLEIDAIKGTERSFLRTVPKKGISTPYAQKSPGFRAGLFAMFVPSNPDQDFSKPFDPNDPGQFFRKSRKSRRSISR